MSGWISIHPFQTVRLTGSGISCSHASFAPVSRFGSLLVLELPAILVPLAIAAALGAIGGFVGERLLPTR